MIVRTHSPIGVEPLTPGLGAEIRAAFRKHLVLVFRDQNLSRDQHKAFGRLFGELQTHPAKTHLGLRGDPEIFDIHITAKTRVANGEAWHTDLSCEPIPPMASALYITEIPASGGGDTLFANMQEAFSTLSLPMQERTLVLWDNRAVHHHAVSDHYPETRRGERVTIRCESAPLAY